MAEVATLEAQQRSSRPKRSIVKAVLLTVATLLGALSVGTAGSLIAGELQPAVYNLLTRL